MKINQNAFTLIEIIFASLIFGIVVVGVVTSNIALQKNSKNSADTYYVVQNTNNSINKILMDASKMGGTIGASGFAGSDSGNAALVIGQDNFGNNVYAPLSVDPNTGVGDPNTFCFYQGIIYNDSRASGTAVPVPNNSSRPWVCYTLNASHEIHRCSRRGNEIPVNTSPIQTCTGGEILGNAKKITTTFSLNNPSSDNQKAIFTIILENCPDPSNAQCSPGTNYPYIIKTGSISPAAQSAG